MQIRNFGDPIQKYQAGNVFNSPNVFNGMGKLVKNIGKETWDWLGKVGNAIADGYEAGKKARYIRSQQGTDRQAWTRNDGSYIISEGLRGFRDSYNNYEKTNESKQKNKRK